MTEFEKCVVMAQQLHGHMIAIDDDTDKTTVARVLASMVGAPDQLSTEERATATALLKRLAKGLN